MNEKDRDIMWNTIRLDATITCEKCMKEEFVYNVLDDFDAVDEFIGMGWEVKKDIVVCPKCAKKRKKK